MLDIVIVNWNAGHQLHDCVSSVLKGEQSLIGKIVVVDNNSADGSEDIVEDLPHVSVIRATENLGFGRACNVGVSQCENEYILFLNPDARASQDSISRVVDFMQVPDNSRVGICGIQLIDERGRIARSCTRFPSGVGLVAHAIGVDRFIPTLGHFMSEWDHATTKEVDHVIGAFFLVRRCVFDALQGFDERFFLYLEDLDFSYRAKQLGWASVYLAEVQGFHAGGGTSRQVKVHRLFYSLRSRILYAFKHFNRAQALTVLFFTLFVEPLSRSIFAISNRSCDSLISLARSYIMLYQWLPNWMSAKH